MILTTFLPFFDRIANPEREISGNIFGIAANLLPFFSVPSVFSVVKYLFAFPAAVPRVAAAMTRIRTAAVARLLSPFLSQFSGAPRASRRQNSHSSVTLAYSRLSFRRQFFLIFSLCVLCASVVKYLCLLTRIRVW
jgi:hypothetical protein